MGFKMKGFPMKSAPSALKHYSAPDQNPHNQPGNHTSSGDHISGGGSGGTPTSGMVICPFNAQSGGAECQWEIESRPTAAAELEQHLLSVHPTVNPVDDVVPQEIMVDPENIGGGGGGGNKNITNKPQAISRR